MEATVGAIVGEASRCIQSEKLVIEFRREIKFIGSEDRGFGGFRSIHWLGIGLVSEVLWCRLGFCVRRGRRIVLVGRWWIREGSDLVRTFAAHQEERAIRGGVEVEELLDVGLLDVGLRHVVPEVGGDEVIHSSGTELELLVRSVPDLHILLIVVLVLRSILMLIIALIRRMSISVFMWGIVGVGDFLVSSGLHRLRRHLIHIVVTVWILQRVVVLARGCRTRWTARKPPFVIPHTCI